MDGQIKADMAQTFKNAVFKILERRGYAVIPSWRLSHYPFSSHLTRLFETFEIDCVFDVGANTGQYRDFLRSHVGYAGYIVSFEPIPDNIELLKQRAVADRKWVIEGYALGSAAGTATFNIMQSTQYSSFLNPDHSSAGDFNGGNVVAKRIEVEVQTLDSVVPALRERLGIKNAYLKLDTQGHDLQVLAGGNDQLRSIRVLQTEISLKPIYHGMPNYLETLSTLESKGFGVSGIFPINADAQFPEAVEFDCVMVSRQQRAATESAEIKATIK
jgi:FkbM family methyltransferase